MPIPRPRSTTRVDADLPTTLDFPIRLPAARGRDAWLARAGERELHLTNPDKVFWPERGYTKADVLTYYFNVASLVLPLVRERPLTLRRTPDGVNGSYWYEKDVPAYAPAWLPTLDVEVEGGRRTIRFVTAADVASLLWVVNLGCIELHTWHSRVTDIERPDYMLIDLDPSEGNPWEHVREIALVVRDVMHELGLASYPKTSGATGLHILAPIRPELEFAEVRRFAKALAEEVARRVPKIATTTWKVAERKGVFVDYGQNARDRTIASAYSIRPTPDARASAPLRWEEVADVDPAAFTLETMRERVEQVGDPSEGMWRRKLSLIPRFEKLGLRAPKR